MSEQHRPFSNGSQYMDWEESNCNRCSKGAPPDADSYDGMRCDIQRALAEACFGDGTVPVQIAERMGYLDHCPPRQYGFSYVWECHERDPHSQPASSTLSEVCP